mgnify:CR=1 FL=1
MPIYVYQCKNCGHAFEKRQSFSDNALRTCPSCGQETLRKRYNEVGVVFKQTTKTTAQIVQAAPAAAQQAPPNRHAPSPSSGQGAGQT